MHGGSDPAHSSHEEVQESGDQEERKEEHPEELGEHALARGVSPGDVCSGEFFFEFLVGAFGIVFDGLKDSGTRLGWLTVDYFRDGDFTTDAFFIDLDVLNTAKFVGLSFDGDGFRAGELGGLCGLGVVCVASRVDQLDQFWVADFLVQSAGDEAEGSHDQEDSEHGQHEP